MESGATAPCREEDGKTKEPEPECGDARAGSGAVAEEKAKDRWDCQKCGETNRPDRAACNNCGATSPSAAQAEVKDSKSDHKSKSGSSSRSRSSSSSSRSRSKSAAKARPKFGIDDSVEVFGLESEKGKFLNGQKGKIVQFIEAHGRFEVCFGADKFASVRPDNLKACEAPAAPGPTPAAAAPTPAPKAPAPMSLSALLGGGAPREEKKVEAPPPSAVWQPIWARSGTAAYKGPVLKHKDLADDKASMDALAESQLQTVLAMQAAEEQRHQEEAALRRKVVEEFAQAGIYEEEMIEQTYQEQLEALKVQKLMRPQDFEQKQAQSPRGRRSRSRSRSSSSSESRSRSRSRSRKKDT